MHPVFKQVIRGANGDVTVSLPIDSLADDNAIRRYYFLFPNKPGKAGGQKFPVEHPVCLWSLQQFLGGEFHPDQRPRPLPV